MSSQDEAEDQKDNADGNAPRHRDTPMNFPSENTKNGVADGSAPKGKGHLDGKLDRISRLVLAANAVTASCTVIIALTSIANCTITGGQLSELQATSKQTVALVEAAIAQANAAKGLTELTGENQAFNRRARIVPSEARIDGNITEAEPVKIEVSFTNSGQEEAKDFSFDIKGFVAISKNWGRGTYDDRLVAERTECMGRNDNKPGMTIFPGRVSDKTIPVDLARDDLPETEKIYWSEKIISGKDIAVLTGCFTYSAAGQRRHTFFCYNSVAAQVNHEVLGLCSRIGHAAD